MTAVGVLDRGASFHPGTGGCVRQYTPALSVKNIQTFSANMTGPFPTARNFLPAYIYKNEIPKKFSEEFPTI